MIHVITGAPCSGKSTYVQEHAEPGDVVVDFDALACALGASPHEAVTESTNPVKAAFQARDAVIDWVLDTDSEAYIIHTSPTDAQLARYMDAGAEFVEVEATLEECLARCESDSRPEGTADIIREWFTGRKAMSETKYKEFEATEDGGHIKAYAATFDREPDCYGDVIAKGAFDRTIKAWRDSGKPIPLLFGHNADDPYYNIGSCKEFGVDDRGFYIEGEFDAENETAQYVRKLCKEGRVCKMSFAYAVRDWAEIKLEDGTRANELRDLDVFEVSVVTIPANSHADIVEVKDTDPDVKSGRRNSAKDESVIREVIAALQGLLDDTEPEEPGEANSQEKEQTPVNDSRKENLLELMKSIKEVQA